MTGPKGKADHTGRLLYPPQKKIIDVDRIARRAESEQARRKAGYWG